MAVYAPCCLPKSFSIFIIKLRSGSERRPANLFLHTPLYIRKVNLIDDPLFQFYSPNLDYSKIESPAPKY